MNPFPPPMPSIPDWRFQVMAAVVIVWVLAMYVLLLWAERKAMRRTDHVRCPVRKQEAEVTVRIDHQDRPIDVLACSLLPAGDITCGKACVPRPAH